MDTKYQQGNFKTMNPGIDDDLDAYLNNITPAPSLEIKKKTKFHQGKFKPMFPEKYNGDVNKIFFRSSWERKFLGWCDRNPSVVKYTSEELVIPYFCRLDQKMHRYFVDFVVKFRTVEGTFKTIIIEIKPYKETVKPVKGRKREATWKREVETWIKNQDKWVAADAWAKKNNLEFIIMTENELGISK